MVATLSNTNTVTLSLLGGYLQFYINDRDVQVRAISGALGR